MNGKEKKEKAKEWIEGKVKIREKILALCALERIFSGVFSKITVI
jgi:hypothetical protein